MTPLAGIQSHFAPELRKAQMPRVGEIPLTGASIPARELQSVQQTNPTNVTAPVADTAGTSFSNVLGKFVSEVNAKQIAANDATTGLLSGQNVPLHKAVVAMEEASVSFQLMVEVRNKMLESYQELMRMQV